MGKIPKTKGAKDKPGTVRRNKGIIQHRGTQNLRSLGDLPREEHLALASKGGKSRSKNKSISSKLRFLMEKGMTDETAAKLYEIMTDGDLSALDIRIYLEKNKKRLTDSKEKMLMTKLLLDWHKIQHGEKSKQEIQHFGSAGIRVVFEEPGEQKDEKK